MSVRVRSDLSVPLGTQLFWQLRYGIATGEYQPGERLPTVREMAAALRVNANTIRAVYARLQDEGWVVARRKVGTVVSDPPPRSQDEALLMILDRAFADAASAGIDPDELASAAFARAAQRAAVGARRLVFVECAESELEPFVTQLRTSLGDAVDRVEGATITGLPERLAEGGVDAIVTPAPHAEEVRPLAGGVPVVSLMLAPEYFDVAADVSSLPAATRVGVAYPCSVPRGNVAKSVRGIGPHLDVVELDGASDPQLASCDVVIAWGEHGSLPLREGQRHVRWAYGIDPAAFVHLRRQLGV